ncbi:MAG: FKBP-type peptidyl-prolyl cis-trans isomerase [Ilumatobacteraceae bacterium]
MRTMRPLAASLALVMLAACGGADGAAGSTSSTSAGTPVDADGPSDSAPTTPSSPDPVTKPSVSVPAQLPTELVITDLVPGTGPTAAPGDTVIVHYVGVRSADGAEFDNSYDRGEPFEVALGQNRVIQGWEQGLVGTQQGGRRQLDIPADLAYGDSPPGGGIIQAGDALSFVIDIVAVLPTSDAADEPKVTLEPAGNIDVLQSTDLVVGDGATPADGQHVAIHIVSLRADTAEQLASDWGGPPLTFEYSASTNVYPGLLAAVKGMQVGGRRQVQIPYALMFDGQGSDGLGLPPAIDLVVVIDLVAIY